MRENALGGIKIISAKMSRLAKGDTHIIPCLDVALPPQLLRIDVQMPSFSLPIRVCARNDSRSKDLSSIFRIQILCDDAPGRVVYVLAGGDLARSACDEYISFDSGRENTEERIVNVFT